MSLAFGFKAIFVFWGHSLQRRVWANPPRRCSWLSLITPTECQIFVRPFYTQNMNSWALIWRQRSFITHTQTCNSACTLSPIDTTTLPGSLLNSWLLHAGTTVVFLKFIMYTHWRASFLKMGLCTVSFNFQDTCPILLSAIHLDDLLLLSRTPWIFPACNTWSLIIPAVVPAYFASLKNCSSLSSTLMKFMFICIYSKVFSRTLFALQEIESETLYPSYLVNILPHLVNIPVHKIHQIVVW